MYVCIDRAGLGGMKVWESLGRDLQDGQNEWQCNVYKGKQKICR